MFARLKELNGNLNIIEGGLRIFVNASDEPIES